MGKSWFSYCMGMSIAAGIPFIDRGVRQGPVLIFDEENALPDLRKYLFDIHLGHNKPDIAKLKENLFIESFSLKGNTRNVLADMQAHAEKVKPILIVIDTATTALRIVEENDNSEAQSIIRQFRGIQAAAGPDTTIIILKHLRQLKGKRGGDRTVRGAKSWEDSADCVIYHHRTRGPNLANGYRATIIEPGKVRAFGLKYPIKIMPRTGRCGGMTLTCDWIRVDVPGRAS